MMVGFGSVGELYVEIGADISKLNAGIAAASAKIMGFERKFANVGSKIGGGLSNSFSKIGSGLAAVGTAAAVTGGILGVGLAAGVAKSASMFKDFESAVANAASVTGKVGAEFDAAKASISAVAMELGQKTAFSSAEAANAMYDLASAGYDVSSMVASDLQPMLDLAAGTQYDLSQTTATMASTLSQFGLGFESAGRLADTFAAAAGKTQASMEKLSYSMKYVGTISHSANMGLEETTAALGLLYNAGLNGESAGTGLRGVLASLISPTTKAAGVLKSMGLTIDDVNPTTKGFTNVIAALAAAGLDTNEAFDIFGREAAPAILALTSQSGELANLTTELQNAGGAAQTMADQQLDTLMGSLEALSGSIENLFISVGAALSPAIRGIADAIDTFMPGIQEWAVKISTSFSDFIGGLVASQYSVQAIVSTVATAIGNIFRAITGGISGADAGNAVSHFIGDLSSKVAEIVPKIESVVIGIINFFKSLVSGLAPTFDYIKFIISDIVKVFQAFFSGLDGSGSASIITGVINGIATALSYLSGVVGWALSSIAPTIKNIFTSIADTLNSIDFSGAWEKISIAFEQLPFFIEDVFSGLNFGTVENVLSGVFNTIKQAIQTGIKTLQGFDFQGFVSIFTNLFNTVKGAVQNIDLSGMFGKLGTAFSNIMSYLTPFISTIQTNFNRLPEIFNGVVSQLGPVIGFLGSIFSSAVDLITGFVDNLGPTFDNIKNIFDKVLNVIITVGGSLIKNVAALAGGLATQLKGFLSGIDFAAIGGVIANGFNAISGIISSAVSVIADFILSVDWNAVFGTISNAILSFTGWLTSLDWSGLIRVVTDALQWLFDAISSVDWTSVFQTVVDALSYVWDYISGIDWSGIFKIISDAFKWLSDVVGSVDWSGIFKMVSDALSYVWDYLSSIDWSGILKAISDAFSGISDAVGSINWSGIFKAVSDAIGGVWDYLSGIDLSEVLDGISGAFKTFAEAIGKINFSGLFKGIKESLSGLFGGGDEKKGSAGGLGDLKTQVDGLASAIQTGLTNAKTALDNFNTQWAAAWAAINTTTTTNITTISSTISAGSGSIGPSLNTLVVAVTDTNNAWNTAWNLIVTSTTTAITSVSTAIGNGVSWISEKLTEMVSSVSNANNYWNGAWNGIINNTITAMNSVTTAMANGTVKIRSELTNMVSAVSEGANKVMALAPSYQSAGVLLGSSLANGLRSQISAVRSAASELSNAARVSSSSSGNTSYGKTSIGGRGTGEGNVRIINNTKIGTVNNNGSSISTSKMKKATGG